MARNTFLLVASLFFYAWGELSFLWVMLLSIVCNYGFAILVESKREKPSGKAFLWLAVLFNLSLLATFKYAAFLTSNLNALLPALHVHPLRVPAIALPLGISFFTFHSLSYVIDVYRKQAKAQRNPINLALYISLFPQLVAGPIIRYHDVCDQLTKRSITLDKFAEGVRRFSFGLGKKMLIANTLAVPCDKIFALPSNELTTSIAWLGVLCYTLQIYFDFSGYSDMAIGLGLMFGFRFLENFNFPYISQSIKEFWRRWHISLSNWFKDYLYIPLGGNRGGDLKTCFNLLTVFFLCGLWHGASWNFVIWGLYHGAFLGLERSGLERLINRLWSPLRHLYALLVVVVGWVFFRSESLGQTAAFLATMFGFRQASNPVYSLSYFLNAEVGFILILGAIASTPLFRNLILNDLEQSGKTVLPPPMMALTRVTVLAVIMSLSICEMACGTYNPFIYFRF